MHVPLTPTFQIPLVALSYFLIAVVAANAALWLAFNTRHWLARSSSALVMGLAVCAMHYTGMAAANFICTTANRNAIPDGFGFISALQLPAWVTMVTAAVALLLAFDLILRRMVDAAERAPTPARAR